MKATSIDYQNLKIEWYWEYKINLDEKEMIKIWKIISKLDKDLFNYYLIKNWWKNINNVYT